MPESARTRTEEPDHGATGYVEPLLDVMDLHVSFRVRGGFLRKETRVHAVNGASLRLAPDETLGLVGESGSGKSTLGRAIARLVDSDAGSVIFDGRPLHELGARELRSIRPKLQMVFQDPYSSLDPSMSVGRIIGEPLEVHQRLRGRQRDERVADLLELVGLEPEHQYRYPWAFSGGQRQRISIARAIALNPHMLVCDEAVSALDVSTQNQIINVLEDLRDQFGMAYLFISHDLAVVRHIADRVAVMYLGRIVEEGPTDRIFDRPAHPYTEALLSASPVADPDRQRHRETIVLQGDLPDPLNPPGGCPFHSRCPYVMDECRERMPDVTPVNGGGTVACHLQTQGPTLAGGSVAPLALPVVSS